MGNVAELGPGIFEAGGLVAEGGVGEDFIEFGSTDGGAAFLIDLLGEFEDLSDVFAGFTAGEDDGCIRYEVEVVLELAQNLIYLILPSTPTVFLGQVLCTCSGKSRLPRIK